VATGSSLACSMLGAARYFQAALTALQRGELVSDDRDEYLTWTYLPGARSGLALSELTPDHRALCLELVRSALSPWGFNCLIDVFGLESAFREWEEMNGTVEFERDYWIRFYGQPSDAHPWAWRLSGHHVTIHAAIVGEHVSLTPLFLGADPAEVAVDVKGPISRYAGARVLRAEEELARKLVLSMAPEQRQLAIVDQAAPRDIQTRRDPVAFLAGVPKGIPFTRLDDEQQSTLRLLARVYFDRSTAELAERARSEFDADSANLSFAWAGGTERAEGHYYAIRGSEMLIEYDNVENGANHIHTVLRHRTKDWGRDLLADHYRCSTHG
jgi:hypothetical protein